MSTVTWSTPSAEGANIASTVLNSLAAAAESAFMTAHDNATTKALYAAVAFNLGTFTPAAGGTVLLRVYNSHNAGAEFDDKSGGAESYSLTVTAGASAKVIIFPMVRIYPWSMKFTLTNNTSVAFNSTGNTCKVTSYGEAVA